MTFDQPVPITEIAAWIGAGLKGNTSLVIDGVNEIHKVRPGDITFVDHPKYYQASLNSLASAIIVPSEMECPEGKCLLIVEKPFVAYESIVNRYRPIEALVPEDFPEDVHASAIIEPGAIIGQHVRIGKNSHIQAGAVIRPYTYIGERVVIQSGAILGAQAFYFKKWNDHYQPWTGCGRIIIEDDVWIGAGTTIAQGVSGDTIIGQGTKIDCQVMIGHGVEIGRHCIIAAQVGIAGKTKIGNWCTIYGQVGIAQNVTIGDKTVIAAQSGVSKDLEGGKTYVGSPADEMRSKYKEMAALRMLSDEVIRNKSEG